MLVVWRDRYYCSCETLHPFACISLLPRIARRGVEATIPPSLELAGSGTYIPSPRPREREKRDLCLIQLTTHLLFFHAAMCARGVRKSASIHIYTRVYRCVCVCFFGGDSGLEKRLYNARGCTFALFFGRRRRIQDGECLRGWNVYRLDPTGVC